MYRSCFVLAPLERDLLKIHEKVDVVVQKVWFERCACYELDFNPNPKFESLGSHQETFRPSDQILPEIKPKTKTS